MEPKINTKSNKTLNPNLQGNKIWEMLLPKQIVVHYAFRIVYGFGNSATLKY